MIDWDAIAATDTESVTVAVWSGGPGSATWNVTDSDPAAVGIPEITPVFGLRLRPDGSDPDSTEYAYDPIPPVASRDAEYDSPTAPDGSAVVVKASDGTELKYIAWLPLLPSYHPTATQLPTVGQLTPWR